MEDYERHVAALMAAHPIDEAMSLAVGGSFDKIGDIEREILTHAGLSDGMAVLDLGCGSGRLAVSLSRHLAIDYHGLDVVQALLDYAASRCPERCRFTLNRKRTLPAADASLNFCSSFSVFTHLLHAETYLYLEEMLRVLKPGGKVVCSFLEFHAPSHWAVFDSTVTQYRHDNSPHLNQFVERPVLSMWADRIGFSSTDYIDGWHAPWPSGEALGQSIAILTK